MIVFVFLLVLAFAALLAWLSRSDDSEPDDEAYRAVAELHYIRRRLDVARFKSEASADASRLRRELREELARADGSPRDVPR